MTDLERLIHENAQLNRQVTDLQKQCTKLLEEKRRACVDYAVREFHLKYGHPAPGRLTVPDEATIRFRLKLVAEEFLELVEATFESQRPWTVGTEKPSTHLEEIRKRLTRIITKAPIDLDLPELMDATHDLDYVVAGTRVVFGYDGIPGAAEVHRANLSKEPNGLGKPTKPEGWTPPDIAGCLRKQGWEG